MSKINQKNTWELKLIDHLSELVKVEDENDKETNFQKASCTLEAGIKIYSVRVDSLHSEAYKVLGGINRAGLEDEQETIVEDDNVNNAQAEDNSKKESEKKISPLSTLESSFEVLNVKKFDVAFAVDPLYHQTSAQIDEGGAKGLLLNNLGIYGGCQVLFDSLEVPGKCRSCLVQNDVSTLIDLSFAKESIEQMVMNMSIKSEICPALREIIYQFDADNQCSREAFNIGQNSDPTADSFHVNEDGLDISSGNHDAWFLDNDDEAAIANEKFGSEDFTFENHQVNEFCASPGPDMDDRFHEVSMFLFQRLEFTSKQNAWAGPDHWKYQSPKEYVPNTESRPTLSTKRSRNGKDAGIDLEFTAFIDKEMPMLHIFAPPRNPKSLLLSVNRSLCSNTLPEDCHYKCEDLVKLFLLPNVEVMYYIGSDSWENNNNIDETFRSWDKESVPSGDQYDNGNLFQDTEDSEELVSQPRQVNKIEVQYDRTSKQVNVHLLKKALWDQIQEVIRVPEMDPKGTISFKHLLATFPVDCQESALEDSSPHLFFICLLHLANEHGLTIQDCPSSDDLSIRLPSCQNIGVL
ncbi:Condensin complex subunit 2/barren [Parasponia andersonii]|uniref:Condensin complex subunit 2/barren n=1 Tax=Parasponia andersonii TaxID=3476 RepID=A0A2P5AXF4_PARAD|nr:Condensin complex subunit 2/barren [Parasponia andersonii]